MPRDDSAMEREPPPTTPSKERELRFGFSKDDPDAWRDPIPPHERYCGGDAARFDRIHTLELKESATDVAET